MKIQYLELINYKRLALNNIKRFRLDLVGIVQLILGTNGSGKSSILQELTPLPAAKENFRKGGKKIIGISHLGREYVLTSDFENHQSHSFLVDGEELNDGRTVTIQKELVKAHFGITLDIHELILGIEKFSTMSPARRREWFTRLCVVDYTYAIKLYKRVQESLNTTSGALKHAKKRLATEMVKAIDADEAREIRSRTNELMNEIQNLYIYRDTSQPHIGEVEQNIREAIDELTTRNNEFRSIRRILGKDSYFTAEEIENDAHEVLGEINRLKGRYQQLSDQFIKLQAEVPDGEEMDTAELLELREKIKNNKLRSDELIKSCGLNLTGLRPRLAASAIDAVSTELSEALANLPRNSGSYSSTSMSEVGEKSRVEFIRVQGLEQRQNTLLHERSRIDSLLRGEKHECPSCKHTFVAGYSEVAHEKLLENIEKNGKLLTDSKKALEELESELAEQRDYYQRRTHVHSIFKSCPELNPLWQEIMSSGLLNENPLAAQSMFDRARNDVQMLVNAEDLKEIYLADARKLEQAELTQSESFRLKKEQLRQLEAELGGLTSQISRLSRKHESIMTLTRRITKMGEISDAIRSTMTRIDNLSRTSVLSIKNELIDEALAHVHAEVATLSARVNDIDAHERLIADIKSQIDQLTDQEKAAKLLQKTLSPVDGLIAEGMLGFIRQFVARMNIFISQVWSYSMEVKDCSLEEDSAELNYKFPVHLAETGDTVPDVSRGSAGMVEMIDLAFRIAATQCLGLDSGPLPLDEFGKTFDDAHREAATRVIAQMMENLSYSQLFMVSHYESSWGAFYKAQVTVVDKRNITIPNTIKYNEHTLLET